MQERAICKIVELMSKHVAQEPRTLFVMGSYRIGKERAYLGAAKALGYRCHVNADKLRVSLPALLHPSADASAVQTSCVPPGSSLCATYEVAFLMPVKQLHHWYTCR